MTMILFLGEWVVRSAILILAGALLLWLLRVKNPSVRLTAWTAMLVGSLSTPLLTVALPRVPLPVMRPAAWQSPIATASTIGPDVIPPGAALPDGDSNSPRDAAKPFDWMRFTAILYGLVTAALLLRLLGGLLLSLRILRQSRPTGIAAEGIEARESDRVASPVTIGLVRPSVLLPPDWRDWDSTKLEAVLAHERSHIRRRDPAVQFVSAIHRALLWANPLSWFLDRSIVRTAELISDDDAVAATSDRVSYAEILLEFVQRGPGRIHSLGVPMARYDRPEKRIRGILNSAATPRAITRWGIAAILGLGAPLVCLTAAANPQSRTVKDKPAASERLAFEVASIKPVDPSTSGMMGVHIYPGGRVTISHLPLRVLIVTAFGLSQLQIAGGDEWTEKDIYNIDAKPPDAMRSSIKDLRYTWWGIEDPRLREMLQALLIDRFQLKFHRETKAGDVYLLERSGKTLQLHPAKIASAGGDSVPDDGRFGSVGYVGGQWSIFDISMPQLAKFASDSVFLRVPVIDRTGLSGSFDYKERQPDIDPVYGGDQSASFRNYLAEAGLKLERATGPIEMFVIDHAAKPSPN